MDEWDLFPMIAAAAASSAVKEGIARKPKTYEEELENAISIISRTRTFLENLVKSGFIKSLFHEDH
jgi:malate dehydrogenase (oxaloacetate-decarboxylating)